MAEAVGLPVGEVLHCCLRLPLVRELLVGLLVRLPLVRVGEVLH